MDDVDVEEALASSGCTAASTPNVPAPATAMDCWNAGTSCSGTSNCQGRFVPASVAVTPAAVAAGLPAARIAAMSLLMLAAASKLGMDAALAQKEAPADRH